MKITGTFKDYAGLRLAYGNAPDASLDEEFDSFLKTIANRDCVLANYTPFSQTFDTTLLGEDPSRPGSGIILQEFLSGRSARYGNNMGIDKLAVINQEDTDTYIWCINCGFSVGKALRYDYEPIFTYGDLFVNNIVTHPDNPVSTTGTIVHFNAHKDGKIFCPKCRSHQTFLEVSASLV